MKSCRTCGKTDLLYPYVTKPPDKHNGPCGPDCRVTGALCLNCRMFHPEPKGAQR